ncbi:hypothetical protein MRB56_02395 [Halomonas cupida]|uniref:hypothetical protein n=1 Tax=Halomonas cupida TaxID=44933 RepID=UPI0039B5D8E1
MKKLITGTILGLVTLAPLQSFAQERQFSGNGQAACLTEDLLDQLISAAVDSDERAMNYLLSNGCTIPKAGIPVSILDRTWTGTTKVRAYIGDQAIELWTVNEALTD